MLAEQIAGDHLDIYLSVEEAEALARRPSQLKCLTSGENCCRQAGAEQIHLLVSKVREARRRAETSTHPHESLRRRL